MCSPRWQAGCSAGGFLSTLLIEASLQRSPSRTLVTLPAGGGSGTMAPGTSCPLCHLNGHNLFIQPLCAWVGALQGKRAPMCIPALLGGAPGVNTPCEAHWAICRRLLEDTLGSATGQPPEEPSGTEGHRGRVPGGT